MNLPFLASTLRWRLFVFPLALALKLAASCSSHAAQGQASSPNTPALSPTPVCAPRAAFANGLPNGKDPFFPESRRVAPPPTAPGTNAVASAGGLLAQLTLKGISLGKERRLALINNITFAPGEKALVSLNGQEVMVECLEIRDDAVSVTIQGCREARLLQLRKGL
jgi:hypothetical protein